MKRAQLRCALCRRALTSWTWSWLGNCVCRDCLLILAAGDVELCRGTQLRLPGVA